MPRGELENRDRDEGVGDLPEDLGLERRELFGDVPLRRGVPTDMRSNAGRRAAAEQAPLGTPSLDFDVRSIYDSRPVNTRDFNLWFALQITGEAGVTLDSFKNCFYVPQGYVAVVREITLTTQIFRQVQSPYTFDGYIKILVDGNSVDPMTVQVPAGPLGDSLLPLDIPWTSGEPIKTFTVADQGQIIGVQITPVNFFQPGNEDGHVWVGFYGNFLQKTNVPANFQIANRAGTKGPPVTLPPDQRSLLPRPRRQRVPFPQVPILKK